MTDWKFWNQQHKQELAEIRRAKAAGLERQYMRAQRWAGLIEDEAKRRKQRAGMRRSARSSGRRPTRASSRRLSRRRRDRAVVRDD
jgi:hypothetical protein